MPYLLSVPKNFTVSKATTVAITRFRLIGFRVDIEPDLTSRVYAELQSGSGPYAAEETRDITFDNVSTLRILNTAPTGTTKLSQALERSIFSELSLLGQIPSGSVT